VQARRRRNSVVKAATFGSCSFSGEQLLFIRNALAPLCCHVSVCHDPGHWISGEYVCHVQKSLAYDKFRETMCLPRIRPEDCHSAEGCTYCANLNVKK